MPTSRNFLAALPALAGVAAAPPRRHPRLLWRLDLTSASYGGGALGDLDGDGKPDLLFGASDRHFRALHGATGRELWSFDATVRGHIYEWLDGAPLVGDFDGDGRLEVFFVAGKGTSDRTRKQNYGRACALRVELAKDKAGPFRRWDVFRGNVRRTGQAAQAKGAP